MKNLDVRDYAKRKKVRLWQIAAELGLCDGTFSRKIRFELSDEKKQEIFQIIDRLAAESEE